MKTKNIVLTLSLILFSSNLIASEYFVTLSDKHYKGSIVIKEDSSNEIVDNSPKCEEGA
jgi:hypothetical protein